MGAIHVCATLSITGRAPVCRTTRTVVPITTACGAVDTDTPVLSEALPIARSGFSLRCSRTGRSTIPTGVKKLLLDKWWGVHCHTHSRPACGYFRASAVGSSTQPPAATRSRSCCSRTLARCRTSSALTTAGSMVVRSLSLLPPRTTIWLDPKSTSWTREAAAFENAKTGAVQPAHHDARRPVEALDHGADLLAGEDNGQARGALGSHDLVEPG